MSVRVDLTGWLRLGFISLYLFGFVYVVVVYLIVLTGCASAHSRRPTEYRIDDLRGENPFRAREEANKISGTSASNGEIEDYLLSNILQFEFSTSAYSNYLSIHYVYSF